MNLRLSSEIFTAKYDRNIKRVILRLKKYLADANEENIHDLRTSIRRLEASYSALPKEFRSKPRTKKFVKSFKAFFDINSDVRDADIMMLKLEKFQSNPSVELLLEQLKRIREKKLAKGESLAFDLERLVTPKASLNNMSQKKLQKRFEKLVLPLLKNIEKMMPVVIGDEKKVNELHKLRIDCKKLRYLMELTIRTDTNSFIDNLRHMQDYLGSIHDNDVMIDFLTNSEHKANLTNVIASERRKRKRTYREFVEFVDSSNSTS